MQFCKHRILHYLNYILLTENSRIFQDAPLTMILHYSLSVNPFVCKVLYYTLKLHPLKSDHLIHFVFALLFAVKLLMNFFHCYQAVVPLFLFINSTSLLVSVTVKLSFCLGELTDNFFLYS